MTTQTQNQIKHTFSLSPFPIFQKMFRSLSHFLTFSLSRFHTCKGVTILELLVALVITVLLGATLSTIFQTSMKAWQRGEAATQRCQPARIALQKMSEDIRSAILLDSANYPAGTKLGFYGQSNRLDFISLAHPPDKDGAYEERYIDPPKYKCDFCKIAYYVYHSATTGLDHLGRRVQTKNVPDSNIPTGGSTTAMALHVKELNFSYYDGSDPWPTTWNSDTALPAKVWIGLTVEDKVKGVEKTERISTIVYLPYSRW